MFKTKKPAPENGVKGGKWFSLIDRVYSLANLDRLSKALRTGTYEPQAVLRTWIPKPSCSAAAGPRGSRPCFCPSIRSAVTRSGAQMIWSSETCLLNCRWPHPFVTKTAVAAISSAMIF
jgi:hypothetical protein